MADLEKMTTHELKTLLKDAPRVIEARRAEERDRVRAKLEAVAAEHGFELREFLEGMRAGPKRGRRSSGEAKYRSKVDPSKTWTGIGRRPGWMLEHIEAGGTIEELEIRGAGVR